jgi:hypothetical protein
VEDKGAGQRERQQLHTHRHRHRLQVMVDEGSERVQRPEARVQRVQRAVVVRLRDISPAPVAACVPYLPSLAFGPTHTLTLTMNRSAAPSGADTRALVAA